ncbi:MAG TPA: type I-E CRISPR-associated protein Cas6/Cse3/CasE [Alphaproteobacteria bacterium]|nr:type I-E CRISPR-associated protein Cas6/Cse3/CasE [Alphaproteobacteria bacterium]
MTQTLDRPAGAAPDAGIPATLYESRVVLPADAAQALRAVSDPAMRLSADLYAHRMIWTLFAGAAEARRPGLFQFQVERDRPFTAIVRSSLPPQDALGAWQITTRPFAPILEPGRRLRFRLQAVASRWRTEPGRKRGRRHDVIAAAWRDLADPDAEPALLEATAERAARDWLVRQGERCGFACTRIAVLDYDRRRLPGKDRGRPIAFGAITYEGELTVGDDVAAFRRMLAEGLGDSRAYGFGLMQIAPAG